MDLQRLNFYKKKARGILESTTFKGSGIAFIVKILGAGASLGLQILLARLLNLEDYGQYTYIMAWVGMLSAFANMGFSNSVMRFIPQYRKAGEGGKLRGVIKTSIITTLIGSVLFALIGLAIVLISDNSLGYSLENSLGYGLLLIPLYALMKLFSNIEKGKKRIAVAMAPQALLRPLFIALFLVIVWVLNNALNIEKALIWTLIAMMAVVGFQIWNLKKGLPENIFQSKILYEVKDWIKISLPLLMGSGFLIIMNQTDKIMLGVFSTKEQVGIYNAAFRISTLVTFILLSVNTIAAPTISELFHQGKIKELQGFARKIAHLVFWPTLVVSGGLILTSEFLLGLFGKEFIAANDLLLILLVGQLISASVGSVGYYLNMTGHQNDTAKIFGIAAIINIVLNPIGIYFYGAVGAAVVTTFCTALWNIWMYFMVKKKINVKSAIF